MRLLNRFDSDRLRRTFCGVGGTTAALAGSAPAGSSTLASPTIQSRTCGPDVDRGGVPDERFHQLARQNYKGDITDSEFEDALSNYRALEGRQSELETLLDTTGTDGVKLLSDLDAEELRDIFRTLDDAPDGVDARDLQDGFYRAVNNGNIDSPQRLADAVDAIDSRSGVQRQRAARLLADAGGEGAGELLADASTSTLDDVLSFELTDAGTALQEEVRASLARSYSRNYFSLNADNSWADALYDVDDSSEVAGEIARDIDTLSSGDGIDGQVNGLTRTLARDGDGGSGAYLEGIPDPAKFDDGGDPASPVKGAALELRTARQAAEELDAGETLRMSADPDVDFEEDLTDSEISTVDERVYGDTESSLDEDEVLTSNQEFDAVQTVVDEDGAMRLVYLESKNTGRPPTTSRVREQSARFFATQVAKGSDIGNLDVEFVTRSESVAATLNRRIDGDWFTARASATGDG